MIDKNKLIEALFAACEKDSFKELPSWVINVINKQPEEDRWIPCDKELPKVHSYGDEGDMVSDIVNVTLISGMVTDDWLLNGTWFNWGRKVIAWQPLPQKYEG